MSLDYKKGLVEREEAERRFIEAYRLGLVSDEALIKEYPKYKEVIKTKDEKFERILLKQEAMFDSFKKEIYNSIQQRIESKESKSSSEPSLKRKVLIKAMELLIANQSTLLDFPFFNLLPAGYIATTLIPIDAFARRFKLSKTTKLALHFTLLLTITNYLYAFQRAIEISKSSIPNLIIIAKSITTNLFNIISKGGLLQVNNIKGLGKYEKGMLGGKILREFQKLSTSVLGNALALGLVQNSITNYETDIKEIVNSVDDEGFGSIVKGAFKKIMGKVNEPKHIEDQVFKSPTSLYTNEQLKKINDNMLKIEPIVNQLVIAEEVSIFNPSLWNKAITSIKYIPKTLEDIKSEKIGTRVEEIIKNVLYNTSPEISKHVNMDSLSITAKAINNEVETTCDLLKSEGKYALYKGIEQYNFQTTFGGYLSLPGINIGEISPVNAFQKTQQINVDIILGSLSLIFIFSVIYHLYGGFKKVYRYFKPREETNIEILPDQRIRHHKN